MGRCFNIFFDEFGFVRMPGGIGIRCGRGMMVLRIDRFIEIVVGTSVWVDIFLSVHFLNQTVSVIVILI